MPVIKFVGQSAQDSDNIAADPSRLVNVYRERAGTGVPWLKSVPGMVHITTLPGVFITAMGNVDGKLYMVCGGRLYRVSPNGSTDGLGEVDHGPASIAGNNGKVTVQAGDRYFVYDGTAISEPTSGAFNKIGSVEYFENYTILTQRDGRMFQWSKLGDASELPGLSFSTADGRDDNLVRAFALHGQLFLFKGLSHELWYNSGAAGAEAFARVAGGVRDIGLKSHDLICRFVGGAFMVGSDNRASLVTPGGLQPVSTPAVETAIKLMGPRCCVSYEDEGHTFCAIIFADAPAWVYDIATGEWHERAYGANLGPWRVSASARLGDDWVVGDNQGSIAALRRSNVDGSAPLVREATSRTLYVDGQRTTLRELEFFPRQGLQSGAMSVAISRDGGMTYGPWKTRPTGEQGQYGRRVIWRQLGQARSVTAKVRWTEPFDMSISSQARVTT